MTTAGGPLSVDELIATVEAEGPQPLYLIAGDPIMGEPSALRLARVIVQDLGGEPDVVRRPESLDAVLHDLKTLSLFSPSKIVVVVESSVLATADTVPDLIDEALAVLPLADVDADLARKERRAGSCLLQALHLLQIEPHGGLAADVIEGLPAETLAGGKSFRRKNRRKRSRKQIEAARAELSSLLDASRRAGLQGWGEDAESSLAEIIRAGLPDGHVLILAESACSQEHPLVRTLADQRAFADVGRVAMDRRRGWHGLEAVTAELERETGAAIEPAGLAELARRTLRQQPARGATAAAGESTARLAAEYRKLAALTGGETITRSIVEGAVEDRGDEDVWQILDAVGAGEAAAALTGIDRFSKAAADPLAARLTLFGLFAGFCRQLVAVAGMVRATGAPRAERNYGRFKSKVAPLLQADLDEDRASPLAGLHPYRLHRVYLAAASADSALLARLPDRILEAEERLKGGSSSPDTALAALVAEVASSVGSPSRRARA